MKRLLFMLYVMFLPIWLSASELNSQYRYHKFGCDRKVCVGIGIEGLGVKMNVLLIEIT